MLCPSVFILPPISHHHASHINHIVLFPVTLTQRPQIKSIIARKFDQIAASPTSLRHRFQPPATCSVLFCSALSELLCQVSQIVSQRQRQVSLAAQFSQAFVRAVPVPPLSVSVSSPLYSILNPFLGLAWSLASLAWDLLPLQHLLSRPLVDPVPWPRVILILFDDPDNHPRLAWNFGFSSSTYGYP